MHTFYKIIFLLAFFMLIPCVSQASMLYLEPAEAQYGPGDTFSLDIKLDVETDCINTVELTIKFPTEFFKIEDFITGDSIINLWLNKPDSSNFADINSKGVIYMAGGIPGGYCGKIPGDPGPSNLIGRIIFKVPSMIVGEVSEAGQPIIIEESSRSLINDGLGTADKLTVKGTSIKITQKGLKPAETWKDQITGDLIPPEPFIIELYSNPAMYDGKYFVTFDTIDKQSGLDRFEILEIRPDQELGVRPKKSIEDYLFFREPLAPIWKIAKMPYVLEDQTLGSVIKIKAIDKAGNEREVEYIPPKDKQAQKPAASNLTVILLLLILLIVIIISIIISYKIIKIFRRKKNAEEIKE